MRNLGEVFVVFLLALNSVKYCFGGQAGIEKQNESVQDVLSCNATTAVLDVTQPVSVVQNSEPSDVTCTFRFHKVPGICQVRLDFKKFETASADDDGECRVDTLTIHNSITVKKGFQTCGNLNEQHMYLTHGNEEFIDVTSVLTSVSSQYKIIATQIPCSSANRVPDHCLQYFTSVTDRVRSFDFGDRQQNNQLYKVCVKPHSDSSTILWKPCPDVERKTFDIVSNTQLTPSSCDTDWVKINGLPKICEPFAEHVSQWKPFDLIVNFDKSEFPPQPTLDIPNDKVACSETSCLSKPGEYECQCLGGVCSCVIIPGVSGPPSVDINNTGFCLEYAQV